MRHLTQDDLVLFHYREIGGPERRQIEEHLASCATCREEYRSVTYSLGAVETFPVPERGAGYGAEVWARLRPHLPERRVERWSLFPPLRTWAWAASVAVLVITAFLGGRYWQRRQTPTPAPISAAARERILLVSVDEHLDRAQMLLVELANQDGKGKVDITEEKRLAQELLPANRLYRETAQRAGHAGTADVLDAFERVLLHISHSPDLMSAGELKSVQQAIESQGILFKVRVIELDGKQKEKAMEAVESSPQRGQI